MSVILYDVYLIYIIQRNNIILFNFHFTYFLRYDFFLVSQSVRQGTVSPTHFNVIHDTSGLKPDHLQRLTYKLTHLYYNWPVSTSYIDVHRYTY